MYIKHKKNLYYVTNIFLFSYSALLLANVTKFSPAYFAFLIAFGLSCAFVTKLSVQIFPRHYARIFLTVLALCSYMGISIFLHGDTVAKDYILYGATLIYLPFGILLLRLVNILTVRKVIRCYFVLTSLLLLFDFLWRIKNATSQMSGILAFYNYKTYGLVSMDSNFSGFMAMINFAFALCLRAQQFLSYKKRTYLFLFILVVVNLSRAAILGSILALAFYWYTLRTLQTKFLIALFCAMIAAYAIPLIISLFLYDYSFYTKTVIFHRTIDYLGGATVTQLLFGNGMFVSKTYLHGIDAHNYFSRTIIEVGFIELFLEVLLFVQAIVASRGKFLFIFLPAMFAGLSLFPAIIPYFYALTAIIIHIEENRRKTALWKH